MVDNWVSGLQREWFASVLAIALHGQLFEPELKLDLEKLPKEQRATPVIAATKQDGQWHAELEDWSDAILQYGPEKHGLFLSQNRDRSKWLAIFQVRRCGFHRSRIACWMIAFS